MSIRCRCMRSPSSAGVRSGRLAGASLETGVELVTGCSVASASLCRSRPPSSRGATRGGRVRTSFPETGLASIALEFSGAPGFLGVSRSPPSRGSSRRGGRVTAPVERGSTGAAPEDLTGKSVCASLPLKIRERRSSPSSAVPGRRNIAPVWRCSISARACTGRVDIARSTGRSPIVARSCLGKVGLGRSLKGSETTTRRANASSTGRNLPRCVPNSLAGREVTDRWSAGLWRRRSFQSLSRLSCAPCRRSRAS